MDDVNLSQVDDMDEDIGTQGLEGLSQSSYVPGFDPSQTNKDNEAQTAAPSPTKWERWCKGPSKKLELGDSPMADDGSPQSLLYYFNEESWNRFTQWALNPTPLRIGHTAFNLTIAQRILTPGKWLGNEEMDAMMYMWRENTTLRRWNIKRVAYMSALFCLQLNKAYRKFNPNKKAYELPDLFLSYGRGELPSHGRTDKVWGVDIDRLYFPLFVNERNPGEKTWRPNQSCLRSILHPNQEMESPNNAEFPQDVIAVRHRLFSLQKQLKIREDYFIIVLWDLRSLEFVVLLVPTIF
ncbi:hypothetical protein HID58_047747 [Brassica napus]|uniref:Uncharacterized protein n=1 Tax=Brassica napus TaxID=3708 RepID=A0ABQ8B054_BRANA|nr:hypothetical protein HID58_047747 [Brassica napus]